jgi:hypothetical protein
MNIELSEAPITSVSELERVPISFTVDRICDALPVPNDRGGFVLGERPIETPYVKNYDGIQGEGSTQWASRFDISNCVSCRTYGPCAMQLSRPPCSSHSSACAMRCQDCMYE